ncbi:MAG: endonuclease/exonuclease/phosphatase family protein [Paracoccaceae bacterium]|nr:endonuclease/exonuclease/phosphatase family protein [Paracoccaceae bacterium]
MRVATFNIQNLRLSKTDDGDALHGAYDDDIGPSSENPALAAADRRLSAALIAQANADVVALQEVFDRAALDRFHDQYLTRARTAPYPFRICLPGNDGRGLNIAALSRIEPSEVTSHAAKTGADFGLTDLPPDLRDRALLRRDCLQLRFAGITLFIAHFKAPYPDRARSKAIRVAEARAVRRIVEDSFERPEDERWIILGDLNEPSDDEPSALAVLKDGFSVDLLDRLPPTARWTHEMPKSGAHSTPDRILISPRLDREHRDTEPVIVRANDESHPEADDSPHPQASDHALVYVDLPGV